MNKQNEVSNHLTLGSPTVNPIRQACILVFLMLSTPWAAADVSPWQGPTYSPDDAGLNPSNSIYDGFTMPTNSTITASEFSIEPKWVEAEDNGTLWSGDSSGFAQGSVNGTSYLTTNGDLTLATNSTYGEMTDFETSKLQFASWCSLGDEFWMPVNLSNVTYGPKDATSGDYAAGTNGSIPPGSEGYIRSQFWQIPNVVRYFNLTFDRWNSMDSGDIAELHYSIDSGLNWQALDNWSGTTSDWITEDYSLDALVQSASSIGFRFYVKTLNQSNPTAGLFIDSFNISNEGEPLAAWFHGNATGQYSVHADGTLIVPVNVSGLSAPLELNYWANWDIQGGNYDNLVVMISQDNGSSWTIMSPLPGVPAHGIPYGGTTYNQQSYGWRELLHPFPHWAAGHANASNTLLKFRVTTDGSINHGGSAIDGWEGIMIDDLRVVSAVGTPNMQSRLLDNFTDNSSHTLESVQGYANDWQYVDWEGHNGPWSEFDSFEAVQGLPSGWRVDHIRGATSWERGAIDNSNGYGPNSTSWPSGHKGMGINLDGIYSNNVYTHLISPIYHIPNGATARLTFNHWICTEAAWDGGSIFTSIDDGLSWQHYGDNISGFYDTVSQINVNSPFFGLGIFDGSTVANGCGTSNSNHTFSRVSGDISHLAGNEVRVKFSFFTDQYVEEDGWYIDDAGIIIDRFREHGTWTSPVVDADDAGWARLTSLYESPDETQISVDVLDVNNNIIEGHENMSLPLDLKIAAWEYPQLKFRLNLSTANETITPRVKILHHGITEYFNLEMLQRMDPNLPNWITTPSLATSNSSEYILQIETPSWKPFSDVKLECDGNISARISSITDRIPVLVYPSVPVTAQGSVIDEADCGNVLVNSFGPAQATTLELRIQGGEEFDWIKIEPIGLLAPKNPSIDLGNDGVIDWAWQGEFHHTSNLHSLVVDGIETSVANLSGFSSNYSQSLNFSILLPARNLSQQVWTCGQQSNCYNGALNFITNGSQNPSFTEEYVWIQNSGFAHYMTEYKFHFTTNHDTAFKLLSINYISGFEQTVTINTSLGGLFVPNQDMTSTMPVKISSDVGGIIFDGEITHEKSIIDTWISLPQLTFRPGLIQSATSSHEILANASELESVKLKVSTSQNIEDTIAELTLDNLDSGGRFLQNSGAGVLALDSANSTWDGQNVTWSVQGKWLLDDNARLYWFSSASYIDGITLGPVMGITGSAQHAASVNDLEVISLNAWSDNRALHDFSDPLWPLNVMGDKEIVVSGEVRYSGLDGINPLPEDVDVILELLDGEQVLTSTSVTINSNGIFNASLTTPNDTGLSGTELKLIPQLVNIGDSQTTTANDSTSISQEIRIVLDLINSGVISLEIDAPGGNQPADGHIWHPGQDIPLKLEIEDDNGLPAKMELFYNRSGRGWESIDFLTPIGATYAVIDLPLIDETSVPLPTEEVGWLDVYISGTDLAGNSLIGGGDSEQPYARIHVQPRYSTWINGESIGLDIIDGNLLPGNTHRFNFTVSDENGIESIDMMRVVLSKDEGMCWIEWMPWSGEIVHDVGCFIKPPTIQAVQRWQANTWDVYFDFELRWDLDEDLAGITNVPSLSLWDENAPLDALFTSIDVHSWEIHSGIDLRIVNAVDKVAPLGDFIDGVAYIHGQDIVDIEVTAFHMGYDLPAENLPFSTTYSIDLIGNNASTQSTNSLNSDGTSINRIVFDSALYGTQIKMLVELSSVYNHSTTGDDIDIVIDDSPPVIVVSSGHLVTIDSDELDQVQIKVTMTDDHGLNSNPLTMNWNYVRQGRIVENSQGTAIIPVEFQSVRSNLYSAVIDLNTSSDLQKGDFLMVWFEGSDASGREIVGTGTSNVEPIETIIRWIAYEPELQEIVTTPYRPDVGDIIFIQCRVQNIGLLEGHSNLTLIDGDGKELERVNFTLLVNMEFIHTFEVEAWQEGDLGLRLQLDGQELTPVPISNVQVRVDDGANSQATLLGLSVLSVFIAGIILFIANSRKNNQFSFDEEE